MQELTKPVSIADYNAYIAKTAPFFSAKDRTAVINETIKRNFDTGGKFFSDPEKSASFSAALPATAASSAIAKDDAFSVAYAYLNALKPVTSYSGLPINYAAPANAEALRSVLASVRPDLDSGSTEIEDVVNFMSEHGFIGQGTAALKATEFKEYIAANKLINNMGVSVRRNVLARGAQGFIKPYSRRRGKIQAAYLAGYGYAVEAVAVGFVDFGGKTGRLAPENQKTVRLVFCVPKGFFTLGREKYHDARRS